MLSPLIAVLATGGSPAPAQADYVHERNRYVHEIERFDTWAKHREYIRNSARGERIVWLADAYDVAFVRHPTQLLAAGVASTYSFGYAMSFWKLSKSYPPEDRIARVESYFDKTERPHPALLYQIYLWTRTSIPGPTMEEPIIGYAPTFNKDGTRARKADGTLDSVPIRDGGYTLRVREQKVKKLVALAKRTNPQDPELAYMVVYESPHGKARYDSLARLAAKHYEILGFGAYWACMKQAEELKDTQSAAFWRKRAMDRLAKVPDPLVRELYRRSYKIK